MFRQETVTKTERFAALASAWDDLCDASDAGPFSQHAWILTFLETTSEPLDLRILLVWQGDRLVAALPLAQRRQTLSTRLRLKARMLTMAHGDKVGFHEVLMRPGAEAAMDLLVEGLGTSGPALSDLSPLRNTDAVQALMAALDRAGLWHACRAEFHSAVATVDGDLEGWLSGFKRKRRQAIRRNFRAVESADMDLQIARWPDAEGFRILGQAQDVSRSSWKEDRGTSVGSTPDQRAFYRLLFERLAPMGRMQVSLLTQNGHPVASAQTVIHKGRFYGISADYAKTAAGGSAGRIICELGIRQAADEGAEAFDMLRMTEFTKTYADSSEPFLRLRFAHRPTLLRVLISLEATIRDWARRFGWRGKSTRGAAPAGAVT